MRKRLIAVAVALSVLISTIFFFYIRADLWFYIEDALTPPEALAFERVELDETRAWTLEDLASTKDTTVSVSLTPPSRKARTMRASFLWQTYQFSARNCASLHLSNIKTVKNRP